MKTKLSSRFWVALTLFSLVGQVAWVVENMYFNVFIYKMFRASAADISAMVGASSVAATVTTVLIGAFSDRIGKRKLLICGGYLVRKNVIGLTVYFLGGKIKRTIGYAAYLNRLGVSGLKNVYVINEIGVEYHA